MAEFHSELGLTYHAAAARVARAWLREVGSVVELLPAEAERLAAAIEAACADLVRSAPSGDDSPGGVHLAATLTVSGFNITLREQGAPFDPTQPVASAAAPGEAFQSPIQPSTWGLLRQAADTAQWTARGKRGMELRLLRQRPGADVAAHPGAPVTPYQADVPQAPEQSYTIRRFEPADAMPVAQCIYRAYGYSYANADLYYPERIVHLNATGHLVSVVAVDAAGAVVGHLALERPTLGPVAESGAAVVDPAHRGRHLLERLRAYLDDLGRALGLRGVVGYPVTVHPFSQRMEETHGSQVCGVALGAEPRATRFKHIAAGPLPQRGSTMVYFKYLAPAVSATVYAPPHHRPLLERIYTYLGAPVTFEAPAPPSGAGAVHVSLSHGWGVGEVHVERIGADTGAVIAQARRDLCTLGRAQVVYLSLPLDQPGAAEACAAAEAAGFFFSAVVPCMAADGGDALCLQYLTVPLDVAQLQVATPFGREIVAYAAAERERVAAAAAGTSE